MNTQQELSQRKDALSVQYRIDTSVDIDNVELTPDEREQVINIALRAALREKKAQVRRAKWKANISGEKVAKKYTPFDYFKVIANSGQEAFGQWNYDDQNKYVVECLCMYFAQDKRIEERDTGTGVKFDLRKGIMLYGDVGCGKTSLMRFLATNQVQSYKMVSCAEIALDYASKGSDMIKPYFHHSKDVSSGAKKMFLQNRSGYCFDDFGTETIAANFGNKVDVMGAIINAWYNSGDYNSIHLTTNLTGEDINESYGSRIASRVREMFNVICFPDGAIDRRS